MWIRHWRMGGAGFWIAALMLAGAGSLEAGPASKEAGTGPEPESEEVAVRKPALMVVTLHADWCGTCKRLDPKLNALRQDVEGKPVLFMKLDLTDDKRRGQAEYLAALLEIGQAYREYGSKTGLALLIEAESRQVIGRLTVEDDPDAMKRKIAAAMKG